jgi:WD40 repeat protein
VARVYPNPVSSGINAVAFSPDGRLLAAADQNGAIFLWDTAAVHLIVPLPVNNKLVTAMAFTPDSKTLATGDQNGDLILWHIS